MIRKRSPLPKPNGNTQTQAPTPALPWEILHSAPAPVDNGRPSIPVNDPFNVMAYLGQVDGGDPIISTVDPDTALSPGGDGERTVRPQGPKHDLFQLRLKFPHLPIIPFPATVRTIALQAGQAADVSIPNHALLAMFRGDGAYYVSVQGAASLPANTADDTSAQACASAYKPEGFLFYLGNVNQVSLISAQDTVVTILLYNGE